jgi:hypothetical protein
VTDRLREKPPLELEVVVDELVLDGWPEGDRRRIGDAFQDELARLLSRRVPRGLTAGAPGSGAFGVVDAGSFAAPRRPGAVGEAVARQVYEALARVRRGPSQ